MSESTTWFDGQTREPYPGITATTVNQGPATLVYYRFQPGARFPLHRHPEAQTVVVLQGSVQFRTLAGETAVGVGGILSCPAWEPHGITAGEQGAEFFNIVVPRRTQDRTEVME